MEFGDSNGTSNFIDFGTLGKVTKEMTEKPNKAGLPKKICNAKIFWKEGETRVVCNCTVCCARALD